MEHRFLNILQHGGVRRDSNDMRGEEMLYEKPQIEVYKFNELDVIRTSVTVEQGGSSGGELGGDGTFG